MTTSFSWRSVGAIMVSILLVAVIAPFVVYAVPQVVGADESYVVLSGRMEPTLSPGDVVIVDGSATIERGDVITYSFTPETVPTTHRVVAVTEAGFVTKGDANENRDPEAVQRESVIGRVLFVLPVIGHVILWTNTPVGFVSLVVIPVTALVLGELRTWSQRESGGETAAPLTDVESAESVPPAQTDFEFASPSSDTVRIDILDLKLTGLATASLFAFAVWTAAREITETGALHPVTVAAVTGGLLGVVLAGWITVGAWRANRAGRQSASMAAGTGQASSASSEERDD